MKKFILISILILYLKYSSTGRVVELDGRSYYTSFPRKENFYMAMKYCAYQGMNLVDILDEEEEQRVLTVINKPEFSNDTDAVYWTSGTDLGSERNFYWLTSGHALVYTNWDENQPDNMFVASHRNTQNCLALSRKSLYRWDDNVCSLAAYFICRDQGSLAPPILKPLRSSSNCGGGEF